MNTGQAGSIELEAVRLTLSSSITNRWTRPLPAGRGLTPSTKAQRGSELIGQPESAHDDVDVAGQLSHSDVNVPAARCREQEAGAELGARPVPG
jgi:hypothetical protein